MYAGRTRAALCLGMLLWCNSRASALNPALQINQYAHTAWTIRGGFFSSPISSIAQTPDGYLWLGTESGLLRFDGVRAMPWQPNGSQSLPSRDITKLLVTQDGRLWIATAKGLASWKDDRLVTYPELAGELVVALAEDEERTVWAGTITIPNGRLCAIRSAVQCVEQDGRFGVGVFSLFAHDAVLWIGAGSGVWRRSAGELTRYAAIPSVSDWIKVGADRVMLAAIDGVRQLRGDTLSAYPLRDVDGPLRPSHLLADRDGGVWIGTSRGLVHVHDGRMDMFTRSDGLSGNSVSFLFEDREGNVWVATDEGLDRFRESTVTVLSVAEGMPSSMVSSVLRARDESIWVGTPHGLIRWKGGRATIYRSRDGLPEDRIGTLFEDSGGRILAATLGGIAVFDEGRFAALRSVATRVVYGIVEVRAGEFWISDQEHGLIHLMNDTVVARTPWTALGRDDHATAIAADRTGTGVWLGFYKGGVMLVQGGKPRTVYRAAEGLGEGRVSHLQFDTDGALWVATAAGLSRISNNRVATLTKGKGLPCDVVHWTIADADRSLWLSMPCGLVRITPTERAAWVADPNRSVKTEMLDAADGVRRVAIPIGFSPPAVRVADGRLWFAAPNGLAVLDPRRLPFNQRPPGVHIEQIVADRKTVDLRPDGVRIALPALTRDLQIDYTALSLSAPEKIRFRYRLENHDRDWQEAGTRRQAFYNDLRPGNYRFRVTASNNTGVWNEAGTFVDFSVAAAYYQTTWFLFMSITAVAALVWGAHRVRLRVVEKHQREISALNERLMKAQEQERVRIAGELHDGVMQEMLAVTMMLGTAKRRIAADSDAKATIAKIQEKMIRVGTDLRRVSHALHPPALQEAGLPGALQAYCEEFTTSSGIPITCQVDEEAHDLSRGTALALFRITQEALGNAAKHAAAKHIAVRLQRSDDVVSLEVADDGVGFDRSRLDGSGGLGLITMRERAGQLNGTFDFESAPGRGTTIRVTIPFR